MARRDQNLAVVAWKLVGGLHPAVREEFRSRAMSLGPMLVSSGLAATAAFHEAKAGPVPRKPLEHAYRAISDGLAKHVLDSTAAIGQDLVVGVGAMNAAAYRQASADARAFALWVRRAAEALIPAAAERPRGGNEDARGDGRGAVATTVPDRAAGS
jgi:CRISPR type III-B/RAMP module-associated protein Cmr5